MLARAAQSWFITDIVIFFYVLWLTLVPELLYENHIAKIGV
jgi:hypothetical protein